MWQSGNQELKEQREMKHTKNEIPITKLVGNSGQIPGVPKNPRTWTQGDVMRLAKSIKETPELLELRGLIAVEHEGRYVVLGGNLRLAAGKFLNLQTMPVEVVEDCTTAKLKEIAIKDNGAFGQWDASALLEEWGDSPLGEWGIPEVVAKQKETERLSKLEYSSAYYEPQTTKVKNIIECFDFEKFNAKLKVVEDADLSPEKKEQLKWLCYRFVRIDFQAVADYYAFVASEEERDVLQRLRAVLVDDGSLGGFIEDDLLRVLNLTYQEEGENDD